MTDKTPIEKAAEEVAEAVVQEVMPFVLSYIDANDLVEIVRPIIEQRHRRRLEKEVPAKEIDHPIKDVNFMRRGHNQCRRAIGLRDLESDAK